MAEPDTPQRLQRLSKNRTDRGSTPQLSLDQLKKLDELKKTDEIIQKEKASETGSFTPLYVAGIGLWLFAMFVLMLVVTGSGKMDPFALFMNPKALVDVDRVVSTTATATASECRLMDDCVYF
ncbi:hypothetical protein SARC_12249 [Sphaeroforma arctica JP610]|uniref:Uncharacterized protein n=1 Tax=Sphaeroforma arctica JP610 TaxID=667725 RepID=A0A0L0FEN2_9EUKA|nr:hypothetical protein SARC_12249 [Sphaeroforma arctica JP610]KNC75224.1 hypothetical protein SARC_12249 [Sphaeroforma arctica JP610]|eukprot:XP_014149126.1 hypothetical protein SARC_12249 [Sphaeroforma arctica JP610]